PDDPERLGPGRAGVATTAAGLRRVRGRIRRALPGTAMAGFSRRGATRRRGRLRQLLRHPGRTRPRQDQCRLRGARRRWPARRDPGRTFRGQAPPADPTCMNEAEWRGTHRGGTPMRRIPSILLTLSILLLAACATQERSQSLTSTLSAYGGILR